MNVVPRLMPEFARERDRSPRPAWSKCSTKKLPWLAWEESNMVAVVLDKVSGASTTVSGHDIVLSEPSTVRLKLSPNDIGSISRSGNDLVIDVRNGADVRIENFYTGEGSERSDLALEDSSGNAWQG